MSETFREAPFREALWGLAESAPAWPDANRLHELAVSLLGLGPGHELVVVSRSAAPLNGGVRPGDLLVRATSAAGPPYSAVVVSTRPERSAALRSRGVPVEAAGAGWYVEVAEAPPEGGAPRSVGRLLIDSWGRAPREQTLLRSGERPDLGEDEPAKATKLTVMTWNIRLGIESSLKNVGEEVLKAGLPDVLALQEIGVDWKMGEKVDEPRVLAKQIKLSHHLFAGAITDTNGGRFGIALLSKWPFTSADTMLLPPLPPLVSKRDEQRVLLRARVAAPEPFTVLTTHLSRDPKERLEQAKFVGAMAAAAEGPVVLMGDFNDEPGSDALKAIKGTLVDCFEVAGTGAGETFSAKSPQQRIDYILCGAGFEPVGPAQVVRAAGTASDHFPVTAVVGPKSSAPPKPTAPPTRPPPVWRTDPSFRPRFTSPPPR